MPQKRYKVRFSVQYEVEVLCEPDRLQDEVVNLNILEDDQTTYVQDTFEFVSAEEIQEDNVPYGC